MAKGTRKKSSFLPDLNIIVEDGEEITPGKALTDGPPNPHDIVRLRGIEAAQKYLVDEVQSVYRSQGVEIADKHIEVIVRQMTRKVRVDEPGDTIMLPGELLERYLHRSTKTRKHVNSVFANRHTQPFSSVSPRPA